MDAIAPAFDELGGGTAQGDAAHSDRGRGPEDPGRDRGSAGQAARHRTCISA
jgi:hypothetical protein